MIENDTGKHYRHSFGGVKLDPARILQVYKCENVLAGAIVKKALCAGNRGKKGLLEDIDDIMTAAQRWKEMVLEDEAEVIRVANLGFSRIENFEGES